MRSPIHSKKHYVQLTLSTVTTGSILNTPLVDSIEGSPTGNEEVTEGALVKAIFVELWVIGSVSNQFFTISIEKVPGAGNNMLFNESADLGGYVNKKNLFYVTQGLASNDGIAAPVPVIRQWFKIPKGKQRMGLNDLVNLNISSRGSDDIIACGFATYKEYT